MTKKNCWEFKKCGREAGNENAEELSVCPASVETRMDGIHGGKNAGRACWAVTGTMCTDKVHGTFAEKYKDCGQCDFYTLVKEEEEANFLPTIDLLMKLE